MKVFIALGATLVATVSAIPTVTYGEIPSALVAPGPKLDAKIDKFNLGGLQTPSAFSTTLNTEKAPINYGNLNMGTGMMPSQIVHYGTENQPDHAAISPHLITTTAKEATFQVTKAEKAKNLVNADLDADKFEHHGSATLIDEDDVDDESKFAPWWYGRYRGWGYYGRWGRPWGPWGRPWGRPIYY